MSRTFRKKLEYFYLVNGKIIHWKDDKLKDIPILDWNGFYKLLTNCRDKKPWNKPNKEFKQIRRRQERAKLQNALRTDKDLPVIKKSDQWNWT